MKLESSSRSTLQINLNIKNIEVVFTGKTNFLKVFSGSQQSLEKDVFWNIKGRFDIFDVQTNLKQFAE